MKRRRMFYLIITIVVFGLFYNGWKLTSRNAYESAEYSVLESDGTFELRHYPDLMLASTQMRSHKQGDEGSFGRLFRYISGANFEKQKVAMTTPVFMKPESEQGTGQMGFVIPKEVVDTNIPEPESSRVRLTKRAGGKFAVVRFSGRVDLNTRRNQVDKLEAWIEQKGYIPVDEAEVAGYDPPWTPGPLRRNEILIRIRS